MHVVGAVVKGVITHQVSSLYWSRFCLMSSKTTSNRSKSYLSFLPQHSSSTKIIPSNFRCNIYHNISTQFQNVSMNTHASSLWYMQIFVSVNGNTLLHLSVRFQNCVPTGVWWLLELSSQRVPNIFLGFKVGVSTRVFLIFPIEKFPRRACRKSTSVFCAFFFLEVTKLIILYFRILSRNNCFDLAVKLL